MNPAMMNSVIALFGAMGVWFIFLAITHPLTLKLARLRVPRLEREAAAMRLQEYEGVTILSEKPILDRAFGPLLESWARSLAGIMGKPERDKKRIIQAGRPARYKTIYDFYAWKVLCAVIFFGLGLLLALAIGPRFLVVALVLGAAGLFLPDFHLSRLIKARQELLRAELAFTVHRIAIHVAAGRELEMALRAVAESPGGPFMEELRHVVADWNTGVSFAEGLQRMQERNPDLVEMERFVDLMVRARKYGRPIVGTLTQMGEVMQERLESEVETRGLTTSVKMVLPMGLLVLPAIGIVVMGPAIYVGARLLF